MADNKSTWVFDLDIKDATKKILEFQGSIKNVGQEDNVKGLIEGLTKAGRVAGLLGTAFFALKTTMDTVFEGEDIKAINQQFEILAHNAGVAGEAIKEGMVKAAGGLADDTDLIQAANRALVTMGSTAKDLPQVMELARKSTAVFGGDLVSNFERLNTAIANGQTRALKQMGIIVDSEKAYRNYAKSIGTTVDALSETGKQQALLNAVIEKGNAAFNGVDTNLKKNQNTFQEIKVLIQQIHESFVVFFEKTMGPVLVKALGAIKDIIKGVKDSVVAFNSEWGENSEATEAQLKSLNKELENTKEKLNNLTNAKGAIDPMIFDKMKKQYENQVTAIEAEINGLNSRKKQIEDDNKAKEAEAGKNLDAKGPRGIDLEKQAQQRAAFEKSLSEMNQARLSAEEKNATDVEMVDLQHAERRQLIEQETQAKLNEIKSKVGTGSLTIEQSGLLEEQLIQEKNQRLISLDQDLEKKRIDALERFAERNKETAAGFSGAWQAETAKAVQANANFATMGSKVFQTVNKQAVAAFKAMGDGSKDAGEAMKGFIFGALGEIATMKGEVMLAEGIGLGNPLQIAQGGALIALGSLISSLGGAGTSSAASSGGGGAGGGGGAAGGASTFEEKPEVQEAKKAVNVNILGSYYETEQTKTKLMEMIREASDATDFSFKQIGQ